MDAVIPAWEELLSCFGGHIELGLIHFVDAVVEFEQIMNGPFIEYVRAEKAAGRIDHIGLSTHNPEVALRAAVTPDIEMIMFSINPPTTCCPLPRTSTTCSRMSTSPVLRTWTRSASACTRCARKRRGHHRHEAVRGWAPVRRREIAIRRGDDPVQACHYCLTRPAVTSVLAGFRDIEECVGCLAYETADDVAKNYASILAGAPQHAYFGNCIYCGHCQPCTVGINIAEVNKYSDLAQMQDEVPASVRDHYLAL